MLIRTAKFKLRLLGPFKLEDPEGQRIAITSRKGTALIAMLAVAKDGERARGWLQSQLWGSRKPREASGSLRRELSELRKRLNSARWSPLICERDRVRLDRGLVSVDILEPDNEARARNFGRPGEFLEGVDIAGEEGFEDWLREQRGAAAKLRDDAVPEAGRPRRVQAIDAVEGALAWSAPDSAEGPSLTVLRFANLSGNPDEAYFADGFKQELINRLSRLKWLAVIAGDSVPARSAIISGSDTLGAKYVLDGATRTHGETMVIDVNLYESARLQVVWSKQLEIARDVVATALDECLQELVAHLGAKIDHDEQSRARGRAPPNPTVTDLIWRGRWHLTRLQHSDSDQAQELFAQALALDPHSPEALINATHALAWAIWSGRQPADKVHEVRRLAQLSIRADPGDGRAYWLAGTAETWLRHMKPALELLHKAVELTPSLAIAHAQIGCTLNLCGRPEQAGRSLQLARRLSPFDVHLFFVFGELAMMSSLLREYREAIAYADLAIVHREQYWYAHMVKIDALVQLGERKHAAATFEELKALKPQFSRKYLDWIPFEDRSLNQRFADSVFSVSGGHLATAETPS
jgi:TolB-like protein